IFGLYHGWIGERAPFCLLLFQMSGPVPGLPFIIGHTYGQTMPPRLNIIIDHNPMPILERYGLYTGTWVYNSRFLGRSPGIPIVRGYAFQYAPRRIPVITHIGH